MRNKYIHRSHISEGKFREIVRAFSLDLTASDAAELVGVNRNTINRIYGLIRHRMAWLSFSEVKDAGVFEVDESYFGARRVRGRRGRGALGKTPVFGLLKRGGRV